MVSLQHEGEMEEEGFDYGKYKIGNLEFVTDSAETVKSWIDTTHCRVHDERRRFMSLLKHYIIFVVLLDLSDFLLFF